MKYCAYKLQFSTPVHFGGSSALSLESAQMCFCADTLFSALCHVAQLREGNAAVERLCRAVSEGALVFSDSMPWRMQEDRDVFYVPRPILSPTKRMELAPENRKLMKKLRYLPIDIMDAYLHALTGGEFTDFSNYSQNFGFVEEVVRAHVPEQGDTAPYFVGTFHFNCDCGLYFLLGSEGSELQEEIHRLVTLLQYSGIGGKISSGYGKFKLVDVIHLETSGEAYARWLQRTLTDCAAPVQMSLSVCLPTDDELEAALEGAEYQLMRRGGFVNEPLASEQQQKKCSQHVFQAGSTFHRRFQGQLSCVGSSTGHAVYRYNRPLWVGVRL